MIINNITKWRVNILMNNRRLIAQEFADNIKSDNTVVDEKNIYSTKEQAELVIETVKKIGMENHA